MIQILKRGLKFADASIAAKKQIVKSVPSDFKSGAKSSEELRSRTVSKLEPRKFFASPRPEPARKSISRKPPKKTRALPVAELNASKATKPSVRIKTGRQTSYLENDLIASGSKAAEKGKKGREPRIIKKPPRAFKPRQRKNVIMPRKSNNESIEASGQKEPSANSSSNGIEHSKSVKSSRTRKRSGSSSRARASSRKGNLYIIVDGKSANIVDEQGLMQHLLTSPSASARYFEASEVEARVQIMPKK
jgi:hypothetical protein